MGWFSNKGKKDEPKHAPVNSDAELKRLAVAHWRSIIRRDLVDLVEGTKLDITRWTDADFETATSVLDELDVAPSHWVRVALTVARISHRPGRENVITRVT